MTRGSYLLLFACVGLMMSGAPILGGSAAFCLFRMSYYFWTTDLGIELACGLLLVAGSVLCMPICWLCTLVPDHPKSSHVLGTLMVVTTAALTLVSLGMTSLMELSRSARDAGAVNASMLRAMSLVHYDPNVRSSFAAMQVELNCCGVNSFADWHQYRRTLPQSCCGRQWTAKKTEMCTLPLNYLSCIKPALNQLRNYCNSMAVLASIVLLVLTVTLLTSSYILANTVVSRSESRGKPSQASLASSLRVACLPHSLLHPSPLAATPLVPPPQAITHV